MIGSRRLWRSALLRLGSIRGRLALWYVVLLALTLAGYSAILLVSLSGGLETGLDRVLSDGARQAIGVLGVVRDEQELREEFRRINVGTIIGLYDSSGQQLIVGRTLPPPLDHPNPLNGSSPRLEMVSNAEGGRWRMLLQEIKQPGQPDRLLLVARTAGFVQVAVNELGMLIAVTAPLALLLAIGGGVFLACIGRPCRYPETAVVPAAGCAASIDPADARIHGIHAVLCKPSRLVDLQTILAGFPEPRVSAGRVNANRPVVSALASDAEPTARPQGPGAQPSQQLAFGHSHRAFPVVGSPGS